MIFFKSSPFEAIKFFGGELNSWVRGELQTNIFI